MCLQGDSAFEKLLNEERDQNIRVFVVWEPVLWTDWAAPSTATLKRISDPRASQYWDKGHLVSGLLGERDSSSVIWDYVAVYEPGRVWEQTPPEPAFSDVPVVRAIDGTREAVRKLLHANVK